MFFHDALHDVFTKFRREKTTKGERSISNHFLFIGFWWQQGKKLRSLYVHISPLLSFGTDLMCSHLLERENISIIVLPHLGFLRLI